MKMPPRMLGDTVLARPVERINIVQVSACLHVVLETLPTVALFSHVV